MQYVTFNFAGKIRREKLHGREYLVAPMVLLRTGVLNGSQGALFYPPHEIKKNTNAWNGIPLTVGHPTRNGQQMSGRDPSVLNETGIGYVFHATTNKGKLQGEGWFDVEAVKKVDNRIYDALVNGRKLELSTGLFTENEPASRGSKFNGKPYTHIARNYRPDHLAILPDQVGACSVNDGCGVNVNAFCPTGEGGGQDNSCSPGKGSGSSSGPSDAQRISATVMIMKSKTTTTGEKGTVREEKRHEMTVKDKVIGTVVERRVAKPVNQGGGYEKVMTAVYKDGSTLREVRSVAEGKEVLAKHRLQKSKEKKDKKTDNAFCPTGEGGGQDNSCSPGGGKGSSGGSGLSSEKALDIAKEHFFLETLETRKSDRLDFTEQSVTGISRALQSAYKAAGGKGTLKERDAEAIAKKHFDVDSLKEQGRDHLDFHSVAVWEVKPALDAAAALAKGKGSKKQTKNSSVGNRSHSARRQRSGTKLTGVLNMKRDDVIDSLVTNCGCFDEEDRDTLNSLNDKKLRQLHEQLVENAMYADEEEDEEEVEEEEEMEEAAPKKKPMGFMKNRRTNNRTNNRDDDIARDILRNRKKPQTAEEWFSTAPPEIQSAVRNAMTLEQQTKKGLLDQLTANVDDGQVNRVLNRLKSKSIDELQDLVALLPPARTMSAPSFIGASVPYPTQTQTSNERAIDKDDDDTLPLPTINYEAEYAERSGRKSKVS